MARPKLSALQGQLLIIALCLIVFMLPTLLSAFGVDLGVYFNDARLLGQGYVPYSEFWDHKMPGMAIFLSLWQRLFGLSWWSAKLSMFPIYGLWGFSLFFYVRTLFRSSWLATLTTVVGLYTILRLGFDPTRDGAITAFAGAFELLALTFGFRTLFQGEGQPRRRVALMTGLFAACALLVRQSALVAPIVLLLAAGYASLRQLQPRRSLVSSIVLFAGGALLVIVVFILWLIATGVNFQAFYDAVVRFNLVYLAYFSQYRSEWLDILGADIGWWLLALLGLVVLALRGEKLGWVRPLAFTYLSLAVSAGLTISAGRPTHYYAIQYMPYLVTAAAVTAFSVYKVLRERSRAGVLLAAVAVALLVIQVGSIVRSDYRAVRSWAASPITDWQPDPDEIVAERIRPLLGDEGTLLVYGSRDWLYVFSEATSPIRHYYASGMFVDHFLSAADFAGEMAALEQNPPEVIVMWANNPTAQQSRLFNQDYIQEFERFVADHYTLNEELDLELRWPWSGHVRVPIFARNARATS